MEEIATRSAEKTGELTGVATDGTADTQKVDVASTDEHGVRWHVRTIPGQPLCPRPGPQSGRDHPWRGQSSGRSRPVLRPAGAGSRTRSRRGTPRGVVPCSSRRSLLHYSSQNNVRLGWRAWISMARVAAPTCAPRPRLETCSDACEHRRLGAATPAEGWAVRDQVSHLAWFDDAARTAATDPDAFRPVLRRPTSQRHRWTTSPYGVRGRSPPASCSTGSVRPAPAASRCSPSEPRRTGCRGTGPTCRPPPSSPPG